jgi:hypothetical protein
LNILDKEPKMTGFSLTEALNVVKPLAFLLLEMVVYAILIFNYYRFLARRDIVRFDVERYKNAGDRAITGFLHLLKTIVVYPIILFIWFALLAAVLSLLAKNQSTDSLLLISMALISTVRVTAYYSEDLSRDLAKMLPFTLLGIFVVDQSYFDFQISFTLIKGITTDWYPLVYYFVFIFILELLLRIFWVIKKIPGKKTQPLEDGNNLNQP